MFRKRRASSLLEYSIMFAIVVSALMGMQTYMKRGVQGVVKSTADELGALAEQSYAGGLTTASSATPALENAQVLGAGETGLVRYEAVGDITTQMDNTIILTEVSDSSVRRRDIVEDVIQTQGQWTTESTTAGASSFNALGMDEGTQGSDTIKPMNEVKDF